MQGREDGTCESLSRVQIKARSIKVPTQPTLVSAAHVRK